MCEKTSLGLGTRERERFLNPKIMNCKSDFEQLIIPGCPAPCGRTWTSGVKPICHFPLTTDGRHWWLGAATQKDTLLWDILCTDVYNRDL